MEAPFDGLLVVVVVVVLFSELKNLQVHGLNDGKVN